MIAGFASDANKEFMEFDDVISENYNPWGLSRAEIGHMKDVLGVDDPFW